MKQIVTRVEIGPLDKEAAQMLESSQVTYNCEWAIRDLKEITTQIIRTEKSALLSTFKCDGVHLKKIRAWAKDFLYSKHFTVKLEDGMTVMETRGKWAPYVEAVLDIVGMPPRLAEAALNLSYILRYNRLQDNPPFAQALEGDVFVMDDFEAFAAAKQCNSQQILADLAVLNIPYKSVEMSFSRNQLGVDI